MKKENLATANFNMEFNKGSFKKGKTYKYQYDKKQNIVYVTTEENKKQNFYFSEFDMLFFIS